VTVITDWLAFVMPDMIDTRNGVSDWHIR
jgi:hypothetical protein